MTTDGPRKAVFATTELLEHMLSPLPPRTLFGCLRTSRKFRDVITNSIDLQRKMGLRDAGTERQLWAVKWPKGTPLDTVSFERVHNRILGPEIRKLVTPVELSFVLKHICYGKSAAYRAMLGFEQAKMLPVRRFAGTPSWRNILLTQPPTAEAEIHLTWDIQNKTVAGGSVRRIVQSDSGVTFGHLFDAVLDVQDKSGTLNISDWREGNLVSTGESTTLRRVLQNLESKYGKALHDHPVQRRRSAQCGRVAVRGSSRQMKEG